MVIIFLFSFMISSMVDSWVVVNLLCWIREFIFVGLWFSVCYKYW